MYTPGSGMEREMKSRNWERVFFFSAYTAKTCTAKNALMYVETEPTRPVHE